MLESSSQYAHQEASEEWNINKFKQYFTTIKTLLLFLKQKICTANSRQHSANWRNLSMPYKDATTLPKGGEQL